MCIDIFCSIGLFVVCRVTKKISEDKENFYNTLAKMTAARYFRLAIPAFVASLIVFVISKLNLSYYYLLPENFRFEWWTYAYSNFNMTINNLFRFSLYDIFFPAAFVPVEKWQGCYYITNLWTMSIEFFGSLIVFLTVFMVSRTDSKRRWYIYLFSYILFYRVGSYFAFFMAGIALCNLFVVSEYIEFKNKEAIKMRTGYILDVIALILLIVPKPFVRHTFLYAIILVFSVMFSKFIKQFFECSISRFLGKISFSLYLVHIPIIISISSFLLLKNVNYGSWEKIFYIGVPTIFLSILSACVFYICIDKFGISFSHKVADLLFCNKNIE